MKRNEKGVKGSTETGIDGRRGERKGTRKIGRSGSVEERRWEL